MQLCTCTLFFWVYKLCGRAQSRTEGTETWRRWIEPFTPEQDGQPPLNIRLCILCANSEKRRMMIYFFLYPNLLLHLYWELSTLCGTRIKIHLWPGNPAHIDKWRVWHLIAVRLPACQITAVASESTNNLISCPPQFNGIIAQFSAAIDSVNCNAIFVCDSLWENVFSYCCSFKVWHQQIHFDYFFFLASLSNFFFGNHCEVWSWLC